MKKPPVEHPFDRLSVRAWREEVAANDLSDEEIALQDAKARLEKDHKKALAGKIRCVIAEMGLTEKQTKIFTAFVETGSIRETARLTHSDLSYTVEVIKKIQDAVKNKLEI